MGDRAFFDRDHLRTTQYADASNLNARIDIYRYQVPQVSFPDWAVGHLPEPLGSVLDVGCGPGVYLRLLEGRADRAIGMDLSAGMLGDAGDGARVAGDAQALPFGTHAFDTTLCMHMLYHVPDIDRAVSELRRVTRPGGTVLVATNGAEHQRTLRTLFDDAVSEVSGEPAGVVLGSARRFRLEEGATMLSPWFDSVERHDLPRELVIPEPAPVLSYLESIRSFHEAKLPAGTGWGTVVARVEERVRAAIARDGAFRSAIHAGIFVCR